MPTTFAYQTQKKSLDSMPLNIESYKGEVLIVDDEPNNLEILSKMLTAQNYDVRVANSGQHALASVKAAPPDIVLLDINMPLVSGYDVCRQLKSNPNSQKIPVIFISANSDMIDKIKAFGVGGVDYVTKPFQVEEVIVRVENQLKISRMARELYLELLLYQLNPHFLFNSLMSIRALISTDGKAAENMLTQLADYLRYLLLNRKKSIVSVEEEIQATLNYLAIEQIRFKDTLIVKTSFEKAANNYTMPAFLLQPLVENAIKYGMVTSKLPLEIELSVKIEDDMLVINIINSGHWLAKSDDDDIPQSASLGVGLDNVKQRLKEYYFDNHTINISEQKGYVYITIEIPV